MINERKKYNELCLKVLSEYLKNNSDIRFIQALWALGIVDREDRFYEEPETTYSKINNNFKVSK